MATIAQTTPFSDVINYNGSDSYVNQLFSAGAVLPITWTTISATTAFIVSPNGNVATSTLLDAGSYTATGSMVDASSNNGVWSFTLTVLSEVPTPQTTVIPAVPLSSTGIELMVPFQINSATGQVGIVSQYQDVIAQHVLSVLMTARSERVMLPTYGVGMQTYVFQPDTPLISAQIQSSIVQSFKSWEPAVIIKSVSVYQDPISPNVLDVTVQYSTTPYQAVQTVTVSLGGSIPTAPITTIGTFST
jgi:Bacteriophage baseplate protein W